MYTPINERKEFSRYFSPEFMREIDAVMKHFNKQWNRELNIQVFPCGGNVEIEPLPNIYNDKWILKKIVIDNEWHLLEFAEQPTGLNEGYTYRKVNNETNSITRKTSTRKNRRNE